MKNFFGIRPSTYYISDLGYGIIEYNHQDFIKFWIGNNTDNFTQEGIALLLEPTTFFYQSEFDNPDASGEKKGIGFSMLSQ